MTVRQQTNNRGGQVVAAGKEGPAWVSIPSQLRRGSIEWESADVRAWCGATEEPRSGELPATGSAPTRHHTAGRTCSHPDFHSLPTFPPGHVLWDCEEETR